MLRFKGLGMERSNIQTNQRFGVMRFPTFEQSVVRDMCGSERLIVALFRVVSAIRHLHPLSAVTRVRNCLVPFERLSSHLRISGATEYFLEWHTNTHVSRVTGRS